jgi:uncharacterized protein (TIGR03435 family)
MSSSSLAHILLEWTPAAEDPQSANFGKPRTKGSARPDKDSLPSIFTAIQEQPGLRLESQRAMAGILVVDHAERSPTEN